MTNVQKLEVSFPPPMRACMRAHTHTHTHIHACTSMGQRKKGRGRVAFCQSRARRLGQRESVQQSGVIHADLSWNSPPRVLLSHMSLSSATDRVSIQQLSAPPLRPPAPSHHCALQAHLSQSGAGDLGCGHSPIHWSGVAVFSAHARLQPRGQWRLEACWERCRPEGRGWKWVGRGSPLPKGSLEKQRGHVGGHEGTDTLGSVLREGRGRPQELGGLGTPPPTTIPGWGFMGLGFM